MDTDLFLTVEQADNLANLGLDTSDAMFCWKPIYKGYKIIDYKLSLMSEATDALQSDIIPTYMLQEILQKLPEDYKNKYNNYPSLIIDFGNEHKICYQENSYDCGVSIDVEFDIDNNILNEAYNMLCWAIKNNIIKY